MKYRTFRPAIAMIELIFSIVIMGISLLTLPIMLETAKKSSVVAFQQESIAIIASHANAIMTYSWDEFNTQLYLPSGKILRVTNGDDELDGNSTNNNQSRTLSPENNATLPSFFGLKKDTEGAVVHIEEVSDDIDDFNNIDANLSITVEGDQLSTQGDYMDLNILMHTQVSYLIDTANYNKCSASNGCAFSNKTWNSTTGTSNIKLITTTLTSSNVDEKKIVLRSFMCNIGGARPKTKSGI